MDLKVILLILLCIYPFNTLALDDSPISSADGGSMISFKGGNAINIPPATLIEGSSNRTFPFSSFALYQENQTISGTFLGPSTLKYSEVRLSIDSFNVTKFLSSLSNSSKLEANGSLVSLNATGSASFSIPGVPDGIYIISMTDYRNSTLLAASPLIVTKGDLSIDAPENLTAGDPMTLTVKTQSSEVNKTYAAVMISKKDYNSGRLDISTNNTSKSLITTMSLGNESKQIQGLPTLSMPFLMNMLYILPQNSAIAVQQSKEPEAKLILLTDNTWEKGTYILILAVYAPGEGLLGVKQEAIELV